MSNGHHRSSRMTIYRRGVLQPPPDPPGGTYTDPPIAEAISGMSATPVKEWDWTGASPLTDWYFYDGSGNANGELSVPRASNATVITESGTIGGKFLRLRCAREAYAGFDYTGVQMEAAGFVYGNGSPFYVEVRLRWTGYLGAWVGPWMLQYPASPNREVDIMETVNTRPAWTTLHYPDVSTQAYNVSNDGGWHRYGIRFDGSRIKWFYDNAKVIDRNDPTSSALFRDAQMFPKMQHLCGGSFPDSDAGETTPRASEAFPDRSFDCDYYRIYQ